MDLCQAVCSSPRPGHQEAGELSLGGILYPLQDKRGSQVREGKYSHLLESRFPAPSSPRTQEYSPLLLPPPLDPGTWALIPSTSFHHHQSREGGQGCQFQSLRREESTGLGHLPSASVSDGREPHFPGVPRANAGFCLILCPEAHENCHAFEDVGRGQILKTVMFNFSREERAGSLDSWVPE